MYVCMCATWMQCLWKSKGGNEFPRAAFMDGYEPLCGHWKVSSGPLLEYLQSLKLIFSVCWEISSHLDTQLSQKHLLKWMSFSNVCSFSCVGLCESSIHLLGYGIYFCVCMMLSLLLQFCSNLKSGIVIPSELFFLFIIVLAIHSLLSIWILGLLYLVL